jgi:methanethiol S-methyltransferase
MVEFMPLAAWWVLWCALHSLLVADGLTGWLRARSERFFAYYRLCYNAFSVLSLLPLVVYTGRNRGELLWGWPGDWQLARLVLLGGALALFYLGARSYDLLQFMGWRQIKGQGDGPSLKAGGGVERGGVLGVTRHPWYLAGMAVIWTRSLYQADVAANIVVCFYFVVGAWLEERKLLRLYGEEYRDYRCQVSMILPVKWLWQKILWRKKR